MVLRETRRGWYLVQPVPIRGLVKPTHLDVTGLPCLIAPLPDPAKSACGMGTLGCAGTTSTDAVVLRFLGIVLCDLIAIHGAASSSISALKES